MKFCKKKILAATLAVTVIGTQILVTPVTCTYANNTTVQSRTISSYPVPTRAIYLTSPTMKGNDVKYVQEGLKKLGYYTGSIDGSFGPGCKDATAKFQKANGLTADGSFGPATLKKFQSVLNNAPSYPAPTRAIYLTSPTMKGDDVKYVQEGLKKLGYYTGSIDGSFGPGCKDATVKFQKANGLTADGSFGPATLKKFQSVLGYQVSSTVSSSKGLWPVPNNFKISSSFGYRNCPFHGKEHHDGIDIPASQGTNVVAINAGKVIATGYHNSYGNYIKVDHGNGIISEYNHNYKIVVSKGDTVSRGQVIAKVGSTGDSTGNHLDFRVKVNGKYENPLNHVVK